MVSASETSDVVIIGGGLIGLSTALEVGRTGARCLVLDRARPGAASPAAAGLLLPSLGTLPPGVREFFDWGLGIYPEFVEPLQAYDPELRIIEGVTERVGERETLHARDGAVDNVRLLRAVRQAIGDQPGVRILDCNVTAIERGGGRMAAIGEDGAEYIGRRMIVAAGAWAPQIGGLPRAIPVRPLKGQMIALGASPLTRSLVGEDVYLVPRGGETLVGATVEEKGFDISVTDDAVGLLRDGAYRLCPALRGAAVTRSWAGTRPASSDMLPILGADPDEPALGYACGHSKNGILLAPATARVLAAWCTEKPAPIDIGMLGIGRFESGEVR